MELILFLSYPDRLWDCGALRPGIEGLEHDTGHAVSSRKVKSVCVWRFIFFPPIHVLLGLKRYFFLLSFQAPILVTFLRGSYFRLSSS